MIRIPTVLQAVGILAATTIGAGMFGMPWLLVYAGWGTILLLLIFLGLVVAFAQILYWHVLEAAPPQERLAGFAKHYLGRVWGFIALFAVLGGMTLALVAYLLLGARFLSIIFPLPHNVALGIFWLLASLPALVSLRRFAAFELGGAAAMILMIIFVFFAGRGGDGLAGPAFGSLNLLLPFGIILFSLSGWNAIEPMYALGKGRLRPILIIGGTVLVIALLYFVFALGIVGSDGNGVSPDGLSGLAGAFFPRVLILALLGLFAVWTSYVPSAIEIQNVLGVDLKLPAFAARIIPLFLPPLLVSVGFANVLLTMSFAGAVFAGAQFIVIFLIAVAALKLRGPRRAAAYSGAALFALAAIYEVYHFFWS